MAKPNLYNDYPQWGYRFARLTDEQRDAVRAAWNERTADTAEALVPLRNALLKADAVDLSAWGGECCAHGWPTVLARFFRYLNLDE